MRVITPSKTFSWSLAMLSQQAQLSPGTLYSPAHRWRSAVPGQAGNMSCPSKETVCSSKASSDSEPKPAGQQLKDSLLQQHPVSGYSSPKQIETFKIKIEKEKAIKGINCSSLA